MVIGIKLKKMPLNWKDIMGLKDSLFFGEEAVPPPHNTIKILQFKGIVIVQLHCPFLLYSTS